MDPACSPAGPSFENTSYTVCAAFDKSSTKAEIAKPKRTIAAAAIVTPAAATTKPAPATTRPAPRTIAAKLAHVIPPAIRVKAAAIDSPTLYITDAKSPV